MLAYKFLDRHGRSPYTATLWRTGEWVEAGSAAMCRSGVHACDRDGLAWWLAADLWEVELDGEIERARHKVVARRGRLVRRVERYPAAVHELGELSAWRVRDRAVSVLTPAGLHDARDRFAAASSIGALRALRRWSFENLDQTTATGALATLAADAAHLLEYGEPAEPPFVSCCAAGLAAAGDGGARTTYDDAYDAERHFQSIWLAARLGLA